MQQKIKRTIQWGSAIAAALFLGAAALISAIGLNDQVVDTDLAIVPGNTVLPSGAVSPRLQGRLDAAVDLFQHGHVKAVMVSGGIGAEGHDEAQVMQRYLLDHGVPASAIVTDNLGINTFETARNAAALIRARGYRPPMLVSQFFHLARFDLAMRQNGIAVGGHVHSRQFERRDVYSLAREVIGYAGYAFK